MGSMRGLLAVLAVQLLLGVVFVALIATGNVPFVDGATTPHSPAHVRQRPGGFDGRAAFRWLRLQVAYGPRPAGSAAGRHLAERLRRALPHGYFEAVPGGLRNILGTVPGRAAGRYVVVGAHYDTKDAAGNIGANDGAGGSSAVIQLARQLKPHTISPTVYFVLFDGEETTPGVPDSQFYDRGLRGSKVAAAAFRHADVMVLLDFVAGRHLVLPREGSSDVRLWARLRRAARRGGVGGFFPAASEVSIIDDHTPFERAGVPSIDLIDWSFPCNDLPCDNLAAVSEASLYASGQAVWTLLPTL
jgi:glutaminyl-peptide cyclotransferase